MKDIQHIVALVLFGVGAILAWFRLEGGVSCIAAGLFVLNL